MARLKTKTDLRVISETEFHVHVLHDPAASYSRSVGPAARKAAMASGLIRGTWEEFDWTFPDSQEDGYALTVVPFRKVEEIS